MTKLVDLVGINVHAYNRNAQFFIERTENANVKDLLDKFSNKYVNSGWILDAGCAQGRDSRSFYERGFGVVGVDMSNGLIEEAKKRAPNIDFYVNDVRKLDLESNQFNGIFAMGLLLCMDKNDAQLALNEFHRVGTDDARMYVAVKKGRGPLKSKLGNDDTLQTLFEKDQMDNMLAKAGWEVAEYYETGSVIKDPVVWMNYFCQKA